MPLAHHEWLRRFVDADVVAMIAGEGSTVTEANDAFLAMLGLTRDDLATGIDWVTLTPPEWRDVDVEGMASMHAVGHAGPLRKEYLHADGHRVPVLVSGLRLSQEPFRWCSIITDLSAEDAARRAADRSEALWRSVAAEAPVGLAIVDADLRFLEINDHLAAINRLPRAQHLGRTLHEVFPNAHGQAMAERFERVLATGAALDPVELRGRAEGDEREIDVLASYFPVRGADGAVIAAGCTVIDITAQRDADRRLRKLIDGLFSFVGLCSPDGTLLEANRTALDAAGLRAADVIGRPFWEAYWWSHDPVVQAQLRAAIDRAAAGEASRYDVEVRVADGALITIDFQLTPLVEDGRVTALVPSGMDISGRLRAAAQLEAFAVLTRAMAGSATTEDVARTVVDLADAALGTDLTSLALLDAAGTSLVLSQPDHLDAELADRYHLLPMELPHPMTDAVRQGELVVAGADAVDGPYAWCFDDVHAAGLAAIGGVPLRRADGEVFGVLGVGWHDDPVLDAGDRARFWSVAEVVAQTLERTEQSDAQLGLVAALQAELLPRLPDTPGLDVAVAYSAAASGLGFGGDWYDVFALDDHRWVVVVGDVAGHGIEAAARMAQIRGVINALVAIGVGLDTLFLRAAEPLARLGDAFLGTAVVAVVDLAADEVLHVSAGHPPILLRRADGTVERLAGGRTTVLGLPGTEVAPGRCPFPPGSTLLLYTDGLVERPGEVLDVGLGRAAAALGAAAPGASAPAVVDAVAQHCTDGAPLRDDVALVAVIRSPDPA